MSKRPWNLQGAFVQLKHSGTKRDFRKYVYSSAPVCVGYTTPYLLFIFYLLFLKELKFPSVFCHCRVWGSAAAPSLA